MLLSCLEGVKPHIFECEECEGSKPKTRFAQEEDDEERLHNTTW